VKVGRALSLYLVRIILIKMLCRTYVRRNSSTDCVAHVSPMQKRFKKGLRGKFQRSDHTTNFTSRGLGHTSYKIFTTKQMFSAPGGNCQCSVVKLRYGFLSLSPYCSFFLVHYITKDISRYPSNQSRSSSGGKTLKLLQFLRSRTQRFVSTLAWYSRPRRCG
jgi:hypothetical protein